jgi:hypothetical protein
MLRFATCLSPWAAGPDAERLGDVDVAIELLPKVAGRLRGNTPSLGQALRRDHGN